MKNYYLTESTSSVDEFERSYQSLLPNATIICKSGSKKFKSEAHGIISDHFYIGSNLTKNLSSIELYNTSSCILSIPKSGNYQVTVDNQPPRDFSCKTGGLILPVDHVIYSAITDTVHDLIMIADMKKVLTILRIKYNITRLSENFIGLDLDNKKMDSIVKFIQSTIGTVQNFPELAESYLLKSNIQELTVLLLSDLIASAIGAKPIGHKTATLNLVERAEALIAKECHELFLIEDIANKLNTTPRTLQKSFKKYRDYSPIQFLRTRKLHRAHKLLMEQTPGNFTVKQAAMKSGISDLNRFSKNYSKLFGELPNMTIKRSRI